VGKRKQEDVELSTLVRDVHEATGHTYGAEWIAIEIRKQGRSVGKERVRRLMKKMGLHVQCKNTWKNKGTTNSSETYTPSPDLVQRQFKRTNLDELWLSDFSELPSDGDKIYAVAIKDQASHRVLGMHVSYDLHVGALEVALNQALKSRKLVGRKSNKKTILHSDQGGQYNAIYFKNLLTKHGLCSSMGTSGDCYDNAPMESFWATMKTELMHHFPFQNAQRASDVINRWLYLFYNSRRRHTSIGGMSPMDYESQWISNELILQSS